MKKLHSILMMLAIMVTALGFTTCSDDDDDKGKVEASIVGEWELIDNYVDPIEAEEQGFVVPNDLGTITEFTSNGKYFEDNGESGSWKIDGNYLYVTSDDLPIPVRYTILQLNNTTLKIEMKITGPIYNEQTDDIEKIEVTVQQTYKKNFIKSLPV